MTNYEINSLEDFEEYAKQKIADDYNKHIDKEDASYISRIKSKDLMTLSAQKTETGYIGFFVTINYNDCLYSISYITVSNQTFLEVYRKIRETPSY